MISNDLVYLNRRASEERAAALNCQHLGVREIHLELAQAYEFRVFLLNKLTAVETSPSRFSTENLPGRELEEASVPARPAKVDSPLETVIMGSSGTWRR
jgi:hypothetical protein